MRVPKQEEDELGEPFSVRVDAKASPQQKALLSKLSPDQVQSTELAGETIQSILSHAPGNDQAIGHAFHITTDEVLTWNQIYTTIAEAAVIPVSERTPYTRFGDWLAYLLMAGALAFRQWQGPAVPVYRLEERPLVQAVVATGRVVALWNATVAGPESPEGC